VNVERDIINGANYSGKDLGQVSDLEQGHEPMLAAIVRIGMISSIFLLSPGL